MNQYATTKSGAYVPSVEGVDTVRDWGRFWVCFSARTSAFPRAFSSSPQVSPPLRVGVQVWSLLNPLPLGVWRQMRRVSFSPPLVPLLVLVPPVLVVPGWSPPSPLPLEVIQLLDNLLHALLELRHRNLQRATVKRVCNQVLYLLSIA